MKIKTSSLSMSFARAVLTRKLCGSRLIPSLLHRTYCQNALNFSDPVLQKYLKYLIAEHDDLNSKHRKCLEDSYRLREIQPIVNVLQERIALFDNIDSLKQLNKKDNEDEEMKKMIKQEAEIYLKRLTEIDDDLKTILLEPNLSEGGVLLEITAGAGGQESMLFAKDLLELYKSYCDYKEWQLDIATLEVSDLGGLRKASMLIQGYGVPEMMKVEAGVHRVQRVPATEKGGRIHTSTAAVAVLPQPSDIELDVPDRDISIDTKRASGAGGQHVNTTDSAVRITHLPTGTVVECQEGRSQIKNKQIAMQKLKTLLLQKQIEQQVNEINSARRAQIGSIERNEKIRTYNYPQDRVTEHRLAGNSYSLKMFMENGVHLEKVQEGLLRHNKLQTLKAEIEEFTKKYEAQS